MHRIITDMINFSSDPGLAIDRDGRVIAWNDNLEQLTGVPAGAMMGKGDNLYAEPFFGTRTRMLIDLVLEPDEELKRHNYMLISRVPNGPVIAVIRVLKKDGREWTLWMKAMPVYDDEGRFIATIGAIRDVTATFGDVATGDSAADEAARLAAAVASAGTAKPKSGVFDRVLGKPPSHYRNGVLLYVRERRYDEAIAEFDRALEADDSLAYVWNDRGTCFRDKGDLANALKSLLRAVEISPDNPEYLYNLGDTLEKIGVLYMSNKYLDSAVQTFRMVVNQMPNNASAWSHIGVCLVAMGKKKESNFYFSRSRKITLWRKDTPIKRKRDECL
jgi:PAS domain S-box-containing protein